MRFVHLGTNYIIVAGEIIIAFSLFLDRDMFLMGRRLKGVEGRDFNVWRAIVLLMCCQNDLALVVIDWRLEARHDRCQRVSSCHLPLASSSAMYCLNFKLMNLLFCLINFLFIISHSLSVSYRFIL